MNTYAFNTVVVFCFVIKNGDVLLIKRNQEPYKNHYTLIGGKKERGEGIVSACKREVHEETGLVLDQIKYRGVLNIHEEHADTETLAFYFESDSFTGNLKASSEGDLIWHPIEAAERLKDISPIYLHVSPLVFHQNDPFTGSIQLDAAGHIQNVMID